MRILVTNDDGFFSPGIHALAEVASHFGEVIVMAPEFEQSAMSAAITIQRPLRFQTVKLGWTDKNVEVYRVNGTPADCVAIGLYRWEDINLVLSGINLGSNLGHDVWHSGTLAAAKQAVLFGKRGIAFSLELEGDEPSFDRIKPFVQQVIQMLIDEPGPRLVNVNLPQDPEGIVWTHQSVRHYNGQVVEGEDPRGRKHFWFSAIPLTDPDEGSDRWAVERKLVSLTPLRLNLTDEAWLNKLFPEEEHPVAGE